ncbi:hypothetical protein MASR1M48_16980 [Lactococcus petauri]
MKVLFFEDDLCIFEIVVENLQNLGHEVIQIRNASDLSLNKEKINNGEFDFILSDFNMPEIPFELVQNIAEIQNKPLLVQTANIHSVYPHQMGKALFSPILKKNIQLTLDAFQKEEPSDYTERSRSSEEDRGDFKGILGRFLRK